MITNLKDFKKLLYLCSRAGVTEVTVAGVSIKFGKRNVTDAPDDSEPETEELTGDDLIYYSTQQVLDENLPG